MKKPAMIAFGLLLAGALSVSTAVGKEKKELTPEQLKLKKAMIEKYDTNKDGKIDKAEAAKITDADKAKMKEAGIWLGKKKKKTE